MKDLIRRTKKCATRVIGSNKLRLNLGLFNI